MLLIYAIWRPRVRAKIQVNVIRPFLGMYIPFMPLNKILFRI